MLAAPLTITAVATTALAATLAIPILALATVTVPSSALVATTFAASHAFDRRFHIMDLTRLSSMLPLPPYVQRVLTLLLFARP